MKITLAKLAVAGITIFSGLMFVLAGVIGYKLGRS